MTAKLYDASGHASIKLTDSLNVSVFSIGKIVHRTTIAREQAQPPSQEAKHEHIVEILQPGCKKPPFSLPAFLEHPPFPPGATSAQRGVPRQLLLCIPRLR